MLVFDSFNLINNNSYKLNTICKRAIFPENEVDIRDIFRDKNNNRVILGGGYNVILEKENYEEDFVIFSSPFSNIEMPQEDCLLCEAGCDMKVISEYALQKGLSGLEIFYDIPSSLGGAVVMNAGAGGEDIRGLLIKVWYYNPITDSFEGITKDEIGFEYRNSFFQKNPHLVICKALLQLNKGDKSTIKAKMEAVKTARWIKQPREHPNAGSVFKRPTGKFVGPMIEELNLKGFGIGGAKISEKHGGFIINYNNAKGKDIVAIISHVKAKVMEKFLIDLEVEQRII